MIFSQDIVEAVGMDLEARTENPVYTNFVPMDFKRPSYSVICDSITMDVSTGGTVTMVAKLLVSAHMKVDTYHNEKFADLSVAMAGIFGLFAGQAYPVADRYLSVVACNGQGGLDYTTVAITLCWDEDMVDFTHADVPTFDMMGDLDLEIGNS